jgi:hypothetical protein
MHAKDFPAIDAFVRWAKTQHDGAQRDPDELVAIAIQKYAQSPALLEAFVRESLRYLALEAINGKVEVSDTYERKREQAEHMVSVMSSRRRAKIIENIRNAKDDNDNPVARFFERHPIEGIDVPILSMTREELIVAAEYRESESVQAKRRAMLCREIADRLSPGQVAGEVLDETQLAMLATRVIKRSHDRLEAMKGGVVHTNFAPYSTGKVGKLAKS